MADIDEWARNSQTSRVLTINPRGRKLRIYESAGKIAECWRRGKPYEPPLLEHMRRARFRGVAVDAGANIGNHTLWLAGVCGLRVVAFEPIKHPELAANVALNGFGRRVQVEPVALGAAAGEASHIGKGRLKVGEGDLQVRTLDSFGVCDVSVIKADVEGMEPAVLRGGQRTIRRDRPVIFAEEWGLPEHDAIAAVLEPWGYQMTRRISGKGQATPVGRWDPEP